MSNASTAPEETDPVLARRAVIAKWTLLANRVGYLFVALSMALFFIAFALGFSPVMATLVLTVIGDDRHLGPTGAEVDGEEMAGVHRGRRKVVAMRATGSSRYLYEAVANRTVRASTALNATTKSYLPMGAQKYSRSPIAI